jgi:hypothetical protein
MNLEKWALIAEIIGAFAIVATLAILVSETRQNTAATYAASYDGLSADMADWRMQVASNPEMQASYFAFIRPDNSECRWNSPADAGCDTGVLVASALFLIVERAYFAHEYGRLGEQEWGRYERTICSDFSARVFSRLNPSWFTNEFSERIGECAFD